MPRRGPHGYVWRIPWGGAPSLLELLGDRLGKGKREKGMDGHTGATPPGAVASLCIPGLWPVGEGRVSALL